MNTARFRDLKKGIMAKFLQNLYPVTDGEWQQVTTFFMVKEGRTYCVMLEPFRMAEDAWVWFDDVRLEKVH